MIRPQSHIATMESYALSRMVSPKGKRLISLSQNECLRPPSPKAISAATTALKGGAFYPDPDWQELRQGLADLHGLNFEGILCGNGSLDLIGCLARAYAGPKNSILAPNHAYPYFRTAAQMAGARFDTAPETEATVSVDALLQAVQADTRIVFVANPGNPTGTRISAAELRRLRNGLQKDVILVIDEAYGEFFDNPEEHTFGLVDQGNTLVLRTFSKAYGMAGFRVGWGYIPPDIAMQMRKVMNPNNIAIASQAAAVAALNDQAYMRETCDLTAKLRNSASELLSNLNLKIFPSFTNFLLIDFSSEKTATTVDRAMQSQGIFLRSQGGAGLPHCLRMTIGPQKDVEAALAVFEHLKSEGTV